LDLGMFGVAISAVTGAWDKVLLKALEILERVFLRQGWL
jgi:hypothetical protein